MNVSRQATGGQTGTARGGPARLPSLRFRPRALRTGPRLWTAVPGGERSPGAVSCLDKQPPAVREHHGAGNDVHNLWKNLLIIRVGAGAR